MRYLWSLLACALTLAAACVSEPEPTFSPEVAPAPERGPTRAAREAEAVDRSPAEVAPAAPEEAGPAASPATPPRAEVTLALSPVEATEAEDGRGRMVPATDPVAIDLRSDAGWPGRALDPVLHVGPLRFARYEHVDPTILRFVAADRGALPAAEVALQWGDDASSRIEITDTLVAASSGDLRQ